MFEFKFGTPQPVKFIEPITEDIEEEVLCRSIGIVKVKEYSKSLYNSDEEVKQYIKSNICEMFDRCLNDRWPKGVSKIRGLAACKKLGPILDELFEEMGIVSETQIVNFTLAPESEMRIKELQKLYIESVNVRPGWDHINDHMLDGPGMMYKPNVEPKFYPEAWKCPKCGDRKNHGNFCQSCGTKRPEDKAELAPGEWICVCGATTSGKFCWNCGRAKE